MLRDKCAETKKEIKDKAIKTFEDEGYKLSQKNQKKIIEIIKKINDDYKKICGKIPKYDFNILIKKLQKDITEKKKKLEDAIMPWVFFACPKLSKTFENETEFISEFKLLSSKPDCGIHTFISYLIVLIEKKTRLQITFQNKTIKGHMKKVNKNIEKQRKIINKSLSSKEKEKEKTWNRKKKALSELLYLEIELAIWNAYKQKSGVEIPYSSKFKKQILESVFSNLPFSDSEQLSTQPPTEEAKKIDAVSKKQEDAGERVVEQANSERIVPHAPSTPSSHTKQENALRENRFRRKPVTATVIVEGQQDFDNDPNLPVVDVDVLTIPPPQIEPPPEIRGEAEQSREKINRVVGELKSKSKNLDQKKKTKSEKS